ncbi:MAG: nucleoside recognition domain-containing protein [Ruminiclostridium sp.]|nr:nucleoside recognition domain-containing protein [Ruminiclostridium sp.]
MLNYIWLGMILLGVIWGTITGRLGNVTQAVITSAEEGVSLCAVLLGIMCMWSGLMKVAERSGLINVITRSSKGFLSRLFPEVSGNRNAMGAILLCFAANFLGLGNAATPLGIKAMEELQKLNKRKNTATDSMILFMVINASCIQLIPTNVIALRNAAGSADASGILPQVWISSLISTLTAVIFYYIFTATDKKRRLI